MPNEDKPQIDRSLLDAIQKSASDKPTYQNREENR